MGDIIQGTASNFLLVKYITQSWLSAKQTCKEVSQLAIELSNCIIMLSIPTQSLFSMLAILVAQSLLKENCIIKHLNCVSF